MGNTLELDKILKPQIRPDECMGGENWNILHGDTLKLVKGFQPGIFDAVITDPPYASGGTKQNERNRTTNVVKAFVRFALAQGAVMYGMELMNAIFSIIQGIVSTIIKHSGADGGSVTELPSEIVQKIEDVGMLESIPLWIVTLLGSLLITVLSFIMILTVYGRMFKLYMYTAIAPIPLSTFAGEPTQSVGKNFIRSYAGVCLEGAIIALACVIFSVYAASPPAVGDTNLSAVTIVWNYVGELVFNLLVLVGAVKASDRIVKEIMGL